MNGSDAGRRVGTAPRGGLAALSGRLVLAGALFVAVAQAGAAGCGGSAAGGGGDGGSVGPDAAGVRDAGDAAGGGTLSVQILEPAAEAVLPPEAVVDLVAQVTWEGGPAWRLLAVWSSSVAGDLGEGRPDDTGRVLVPHVALPGGPQTLTVRVTPDDGGASATASISVTVRRRPSAPTVVIEPPAPATGDTLTAVITQDSLVDPGTARTYAYRWRRDGVIVTGQTGTSIAAHLTEKGQEWEVAVTPSADGVEGTLGRATVVVRNTPPSLAAARVLPTVATTDTLLRCTPEGGTDADGDAVTFATAWRVDGAVVEGATGDTLDGAHFERGDRVTCALTPSDGEEDGAPVISEGVVIANSEPWADTVTLAPGEGATTTPFRCEVGASGDADGDPVGFRWSWTVDGAAQPGAVAQTFTPLGAARGQRLACGVQPDDGFGVGRLVVSAPVTLGNTPPAVETVLLLPAGATTRDLLTCAPQDGADADGDPVTYTYVWYVDGVPVEGATGATLDAATGGFARDDVVDCEAIPSDGFAAGAPERSKVPVTIANALPLIDAVAVEPDGGDVRTAFRCVATGWDDPDLGDARVVRWSWYRNDASVAAQTGELYAGPLAPFDRIACEGVPHDGIDYGPAVRSAAVDVSDLPPTIGSVLLVPEEPNRTATLECQPQSWSDPEGAPPDYRYAWQVSGAIVEGETGPTLAGTTVRRGEVVLCRVTPWDGVQEGAAVWSNAVAIGNTPPALGAVAITPPAGNHNTTFRCEPTGATDGDGDTVFFAFEWYQDSVRLPGVATATVRIDDYENSDQLVCRVTPSDGIDDGAALTSAAATLFDVAPLVDAVVVTPSPAVVTDTLTCAPQGWTDPDDGEPTYHFEWFVNDAPVAGAATAQLAPGPFAKHDVVVCRVTPDDGHLAGPTRRSDPVPVVNSPPVIGSVTVGGTGIDGVLWFRCVAHDVVDADADPVTFVYRWFRNGLEVAGADSELLPGADFEFDEDVQCELTPWDGEEWGAPVASNVLDVQNTPPEAEILEPRTYQLQLGSYVEFVGHVWDLQDPPQDLYAYWESSLDGVLAETPPDGEGMVGFATNELSQGIHKITLHVRDTFLEWGKADVSFVVDPVCGSTSYIEEEDTNPWEEGFETGNLTRWSFANRKYVAAGEYPYDLSRCSNPHEFRVDPAAARTGDLGLLIQLPVSPADDVFSVAKAFPDTATILGVYAECWVYAVDRVNVQFGFYHEGEATPPAEPPRYSGGAILRNASTSFTYVPPGPAAVGTDQRPAQPVFPLGQWVKLSLSRDMAAGRFQYFEDGSERYSTEGLDARPPAGFSIGLTAAGGGVTGYIDDCTVLVVR